MIGHSFGGLIALGLGARRPELFRSLCVHEPPVFALVADDPIVTGLDEPTGIVLSLIDRGEHEAAARFFVDEVAIGPGAWDALPPDERATMTANAGTFAGELRDPAWPELDLPALARLRCPVLLTHGSESPPFFAAIVTRLAAAIEGAELRFIPGGGHVPQLTHPAEWVAVVTEFLRGAARRGRSEETERVAPVR